MATNYPTSIQTFGDPISTDTLSGHAALHTDINDTVEAIQNKLGVDGDTDVTTVDRRVALLELEITPAGSLTMFAGSSAPSGWLLCNGAEHSRTTYADLFAVVGTTYGVGNGSTTFNVPDLRNRAPVGSGSSYTLGQEFGATTDSFTIASGNLPRHTHDLNGHTHSLGNHTHSLGNHTHTFDHSHDVSVSGGNHQHGTDSPADSFVTQDNAGTNGAVQTGSGGFYAYNQATTAHSGDLTLTGSTTSISPDSITSGNNGNTGGNNDNTGGNSDNTSDGGFANSSIGVDIIQPSLGINFIIKV